MSAKFLREPEVLARVPFSKPTLHRFVREGRFPAPIKFGTRGIAWLVSEIDAWEQKLLDERDARFPVKQPEEAA